MIRIECPCGAKLKAGDDQAGRELVCPKCGAKACVPLTSAPLDVVADNVFRDKPWSNVTSKPSRRKRFAIRWIVVPVVLAFFSGIYLLWESQEEMAFRVESDKYLRTVKIAAKSWPASPREFSAAFDENDKRFDRLQAIVENNARLKIQARRLVEIQNLLVPAKVYFSQIEDPKLNRDVSKDLVALGQTLAMAELKKQANNDVNEAFRIIPEVEVFLEDHRRFTISRLLFP